MGMTHGEPETYPRTADVMLFCEPDWAVKDRRGRDDRPARLGRPHQPQGGAAQIHDRPARPRRPSGPRWRRASGRSFEGPRPFHFEDNGDRYGWTEGEDGRHHLTLFIQNGRIRDVEEGPLLLLTGLRRIAEIHDGEFRLTANQNVIVANVSSEKRAEIEALVAEFGLTSQATALRRNSMACVALPTCGLALAESERYLPDLVGRLEEKLAAHGLAEDEITIRMTGCPNGCARPYIAEIGLVGKGPGRYNLYLGAAFDGSRLSKLYLDNVDEAGIVATLDALFGAYAGEREDGERFGDFLIRAGHVARTESGREFHDNTGPLRAVA